MRGALRRLAWLALIACAASAPAHATECGAETPGLPPLDCLIESTAPGEEISIRGVAFQGNLALSDLQLQEVVAPFLRASLGAQDVTDLRDAVTDAYLAAGYVSSGAVVPPQGLSGGILRLQIVEGVLEEVSVEGVEQFDAAYVRSRLRRDDDQAVNAHTLQRRLELLQRDPRIRSIHAELLPGALRGESRLLVRVEEEQRVTLGLSAGNSWSPAVGGTGAEALVGVSNLLGRGDRASLALGLTEGLHSVEAGYSLPLGTRDTTLELELRWMSSDVVEDPFDELDIEADSVSYQAALRHPVYRSERSELWLALEAEWRRSKTRMLGERFSFSRGADDGETTVSMLHLVGEWGTRSATRAFALRSDLSVGIDALGATHVSRPGGQVPDSTFLVWLGQLQWAQRLPASWRSSELLFRTDVQLSADPLFPAEQISVGGTRTVRGFRRHRLVRDNGVVASLELRLPLLRSPDGRARLELAPFVDFGHAWNHDLTPEPKTLSSAGIGLRYQPTRQLGLALYWAGRLRNLDRRGDDLQDHGIHFEATWLAF